MKVSRNSTGYRVACSNPECPSRYRGVLLYHTHRYAMNVAVAFNKVQGHKSRKIVMMKGHFAVVDFTWERDD
jgi:hypothetical protein